MQYNLFICEDEKLCDFNHVFFNFVIILYRIQRLPKVNAALAGKLQDQDEEESKTKKSNESVSF